MNRKISKELIEKRVENLISEWDYEKRKNNLNECPLYSKNKKCHDLENLNCLFCYCPNYNISRCEIKSPDAKYIQIEGKKVLDCSVCTFPHKKENVRKILISKLYNSLE
jgi:Zn-finger protein